MLRPRILIIEYIFGIYFFLQTLLPHEFSALSCLIGFTILSVNKYLFEGFRVVYLFAVFIQLALIVFTSFYLRLALSILMILSIWFFPIFKYPQTTGKYRVGYRTLHIHNVTTVGIYYPTLQKTKDVEYLPHPRTWERFADIMRFFAQLNKRRSLPKIFFKFGSSFLEHQYLGVNRDAQVITPEDQKFPVIVFSHGLSANIHLYSILLKEWASHGFIIFSIDHDEEIYLNPEGFKSNQEYLERRNDQLNIRKETVAKVLDLISDKKQLQSIFQSQDIVLNYSKLFLAGHSFGGATVGELAVEDKRVTAGVLLLDPWFECCDQNVIFEAVEKPMLSLRSTRFDSAPNLRNWTMKHVKSNTKDGLCLSGLFKNSAHNSATDMMILMPRELSLVGMIYGMKDIEEKVISQNVLTTAFFKTALGFKGAGKGGDNKEKFRDLVLSKYRKDLKEQNVNDTLIVDEI